MCLITRKSDKLPKIFENVLHDFFEMIPVAREQFWPEGAVTLVSVWEASPPNSPGSSSERIQNRSMKFRCMF